MPRTSPSHAHLELTKSSNPRRGEINRCGQYRSVLGGLAPALCPVPAPCAVTKVGQCRSRRVAGRSSRRVGDPVRWTLTGAGGTASTHQRTGTSPEATT
jgi:hypothetical protein